jgi:hypothetical protein
VGGAGVNPGIELQNCDGVLIEACRLGLSTTYNGVAETTQGNGVQLDANCANVICDGVYVGGVIGGGSVAYFNVNNTPPSLGNEIRNTSAVSGVVTYTGLWDGVVQTQNLTLTAATPGNLAVTYSVRDFQYIKKGNRIHFNFRLETSAFTYTTATGQLQLTGLPYTVRAGNPIATDSLMFGGITKAGFTQFTPYASANTTFLGIVASGTGVAASDVNITDLPTGGTILLRGAGHYFL